MNTDKLILGTVQLGLDYGINNHSGKPSQQEAFSILSKASNRGVSCLDTAAAYGNSEDIIGAYHREVADHPFKIITKFHASDMSPLEVVVAALKKLSVDRIDTLLFHSFADYKMLRQTSVYQELCAQVGETIAHLGASVYTNEELEELSEDPTIEVIQLPFNLLDNEANRGDTLKLLKERGKSIHTRSVFLQGLFFKDAARLPETLKPLKLQLVKIHELANDSGVPVGALALQYVLSKSYIDGVLFGVESIDQLITNLNWLSIDIEMELFEKIDAIRIERKDLLNPSNW